MNQKERIEFANRALLRVRWIEPLQQNLLRAARGTTCTTSQLLNSKIWLTRPQHIQLAPNDQPLEDILLQSLSFQGFQSNIEHVLDVGMRIGHFGAKLQS
jgi:hypothetical protein